ncbi:MAG: glycosyltransferase family 39 protein [Bacteroidota bacterium]
MQVSAPGKWIIGVLFVVAIYFPIFLHLDGPPVKVWDESLFAMRAYHMAEFGTYLPNFETFPGISFYRNLKPPFGTFLQALSFKTLGVSELSLRLPIALFVLATIGLFLFYSSKYWSTWQVGVAPALILLTSAGYLRPHVARTGDHDTILAFWLLLSLGIAYQMGQAQKSGRLVWALAVVLFMAFLTKSVVAFFFVPAYLVYFAYAKCLLPLLRRASTYLAGVSLLGAIGLYYWLMEYTMPGFMEFVQETVLGRYVVERNQLGRPFSFYWMELVSSKFVPWVGLLLVNSWMLLRSNNLVFKHWSVLLWSAVVSCLLIISFSQTKLDWYDAAVYPPLALLTGWTLWEVARYFWRKPTPTQQLTYWLGLMLLCALPYTFTLQRIHHLAWDDPLDQHAYLMRQQQGQDYIVYCQGFNGQVGFYARWLNEQKGSNIQVATFWDEVPFRENNRVLVCHTEKRAQVQAKFETEQLAAFRACTLLLLKQAK